MQLNSVLLPHPLGPTIPSLSKLLTLYDKLENSVQRYDTLLLNKVTKEKDKYLALVLVLSCVCFLTMLFLLIEVNRDNKRKNEI